MANSLAAASKLLNIRNSALHNLIRRHLLHHSAAVATSKNLIPSTSNQSLNLFLLKTGGVKSRGNSSNANLPLWPLGSSLMRIEGARTYATKEDHSFEDPDGVEDYYDDDDDDDIEYYSGSDFDDEDEYEDPDEDPDIK